MLITPTLVRARLSDPAISAVGAPAQPAAGQSIVLTMTLANSGDSVGPVSVSADLVRADNTATVEGHFFTAPNPQPNQTTGQVASVNVPAHGSTQLVMYSGPISTQGAFSPPLSSEDILITITPPSGSPTVYSVANGISVPAAPAQVSVTAVSVGVGA